MISLPQKIPTLFAIPKQPQTNISIIYSIILLPLSLSAHFLSETWAEFPFFHIACFILLSHGIVTLATTNANILFLTRYFLVWSLIFITCLTWALSPNEVFVAPFGLMYQTYENTRIIVLSGIFSLCGSLIGWQLSLRKLGSTNNQHCPPTSRQNKYIFFVGLILTIGFSALYVWRRGGFILGGSSYVDTTPGFEIHFGVYNLFHFTGIALILLSSIHDGKLKYIFLCILTLIPGLLAGSRADFLPQAAILLVCAYNTKVASILQTHRYRKFIYYLIIACLLLIVVYHFSFFVAFWRTGVGWKIAFDHIYTESLFISQPYGHPMVWIETGNMMLGGFYAAIVNAKEGLTGFLYGKSYLDYFLIAPPGFLGLPRPKGLEWFTNIGEMQMSQGGIFEVAEAYWNFGLIGCFITSLSLSYLFAWLLRKGIRESNYFYLTWYLVFGLHGFRSIWYQNFSYFRLMTVMVTIWIIGTLFYRWFIRGKPYQNRYRSPQVQL